ncbi:MAG: DinB family protein [Actinobacteria bacterium]|nr:DinB family protein [Actinomycetota bacterium]MCG2803765.1 DinB family protein [Cellulomonas sp.]
MDTPKQTLHRALRTQRAVLIAKLDGLDEYDLRRPMTPTATNLLGLVKHVASVQLGYFGAVFGRPSPRDPLPWDLDDADPDGDMYAFADETRAQVLDLWEHSAAHSDATIEALDLDAVGHVPWWGEHGQDVTLHRVLVHMGLEAARHAGHADLCRELIDGAIGYAPGNPNLPRRTDDDWSAYRARVEQAARAAAGLGD